MRDPRLRSGRAARRPDDCDDDAGDDHRAGEKHQPDFPNCFPARFFWEAILLFILAKCLILLVQLGGLEPPTSCSTDKSDRVTEGNGGERDRTINSVETPATPR